MYERQCCKNIEETETSLERVQKQTVMCVKVYRKKIKENQNLFVQKRKKDANRTRDCRGKMKENQNSLDGIQKNLFLFVRWG